MKMNFDIIRETVRRSLLEDIGSGDITAELIKPEMHITAELITREAGIICGIAWVNEVYRQLDETLKLNWLVDDGEQVAPKQKLLMITGNARAILTGERTALNWLQTLSGTATLTHEYVEALQGSKTQLLDTRKTIPGLRYAQKYAVACGGGHNHRFGLYDAYLIKENHIMSCGSIIAAAKTARAQHADVKLEVEVENLVQLEEAIQAQVDVVMLDNFDLSMMQEAVAKHQGRVKLEVSGNVSLDNIKQIAATGVDYISVGAITKHVHALDLSMRVKE